MKKITVVRFLLPAIAAGAAFAVSAMALGAQAGPARSAGSGLRQPFAIVLSHNYGSTAARVINMSTSRVAGRVRVPVAGSSFEWVAAAASSRTFVLADETQAIGWRFYLVRLASDGRPGTLVRIPVPALHNVQITGMAVSADVSKLAIVVQNQSNGLMPVSRIETIATATGITRTWSSPGGADSLSWAGDRTVAFSWQDTRGPLSGIRLLDTAAPGSSLRAARLLVPFSLRFRGLRSPGVPTIAPGGSVLFAVLAAGRNGTSSAIVRFSVRTGRPLAVLTGPAPATPGGKLLYSGVLRTDNSGRNLFTQVGNVQDQISGTNSVPVRLYKASASPVPWSNMFAW